jgi:hypothetical protein
MDYNNELHQLIANKINKNIPPEIVDQISQQLQQLDDQDKTMVSASRHLAELAVEHEDPFLHYAATAILWITGLLNSDNIETPEDLLKYAYRTWGYIQEALSEIVEDSLNDM